MASNWKVFCGRSDFKISGEGIQVILEGGRYQIVEVEASDELIYFHSVVAKAAVVTALENASLRAWQRNREIPIVAFRVDQRGRMVGEAWIPTAGLTRDEFQIAVKTMAIECDRFEFQLTGTDTS